MRLGFSLGTLLEHDEVLACAKIADAAGVESVWIPESWGREAFVTLGSVAALTKNVLLGTGIIGIYSRSAASIAMAATTLDRISNGRTMLGLGASSKAIVENWHGAEFTNQLARMREYVEAIRMICKGEKVNYKGRFVRVNDFKLGFEPLRSHIPIHIAAVNERMLDLASEIADGVLLFLRPIEDLQKIVNKLRASNNKIEISCIIITTISKDAELARERARKTISFYAAVGRIYGDYLASHGFGSEVSSLSEHYRKHGVDGLHKLVSERMLDSIAVAGTPEECTKKFRRFTETGISLPIVQFNPVGETEKSFRETLATLLEKQV